jgi:hypothetical protein
MELVVRIMCLQIRQIVLPLQIVLILNIPVRMVVVGAIYLRLKVTGAQGEHSQ